MVTNAMIKDIFLINKWKHSFTHASLNYDLARIVGAISIYEAF